MKWINKIILVCVSLLCVWSCKDKDDVMPMRYYEFSNNDVVVDNEASDVEVGITNVEALGVDWHIIDATVTDDVCVDCVINNKGTVDGDFSSGLAWGWFNIQKSDNGKSVKIHVDANNNGGKRTLVVCIGSFMDYGCLTLIQKGIK